MASHINAHRFTNPDVTTLLHDLAAVQPSLATRLQPWLFAAGFPVLHVQLNASLGQVIITQVSITFRLNLLSLKISIIF